MEMGFGFGEEIQGFELKNNQCLKLIISAILPPGVKLFKTDFAILVCINIAENLDVKKMVIG